MVAIRRQIGHLALAAVCVIILLLAACGTNQGLPNPSVVDTSTLLNRVGVYGFPSGSDAVTARALGIDFAVAEPGSGVPRPLLSLDPWPKSLIYSTVCPKGPAHCVGLSTRRRGRLLEEILSRARRDAQNPSVLGIYLTDDYWTDLTDLLPDAYAAIRRAGFTKPIVCGVGASLALKSSIRPNTDRRLQLSLRNYSAKWCDAVMLYIYAPIGRGPASAAYDWSMKVPLKQALDGLRAKGFQLGRQLLIGTPQAFQYYPAIAGPGDRDRYWVGPSASELDTQITAFCAAGARSIIGYTWNDEQKGIVSELFNSPQLQAAFAKGVQNCRLNYW